MKLHKLGTGLGAAATMLLIAVGLTPAKAASDKVGRFTPATCKYTLPGEKMRCGVLDVPEDYSKPNGRRIQLPVAILPSRTKQPRPDPIVYLNGGPGASSMGWLGVTQRVQHIRDDREVVVIEPRGAPAATPSLACDDDKLRECYARFKAAGIDLEQYNNVNTARDVEELRAALGVPSWNLWGISYGTTWAMYIIRAHPAGVRSVVLDSPTAPGADIARADVTSFLDGVSRMAWQCSAQADCKARYGDLRARILEVVPRLNASPMQLSDPFLREAIGPQLTGDHLLNLIATGLQSGRRFRRVPAFIDFALRGDEAALARIARVPDLPLPVGYDLPDSSQGLTLSIYCGELHYSRMEDGPGPTLETWPAPIAEALVPEYYRQCKRGEWPIAPIERSLLDTVKSAIPTLVLLGEQDPITSRAEADRALAGLSRGELVTVPGTTHGATENEPCAAAIMRNFMNGPAKRRDLSCLSRIPRLTYSVE